jgi:hypothetical protein
MKLTGESRALDSLSFLGVLGGVSLLVAAYFAPASAAVLAVPALAMLFPGLLYGMR